MSSNIRVLSVNTDAETHIAYNLGWKIASVVSGISERSLLSTYEEERLQVAKDLIEFDHKFARLFSGRPAKDESDKDGVNMEEFRAAYAKGNIFTSGVAVKYGPNLIVRRAMEEPLSQTVPVPASENRAKQYLATNIQMGCRIPSQQVLNQSDARPWQVQELLKSDGRWRLLVFAGNMNECHQRSRVQTLATRLADSKSFIRRFTPPASAVDSIIEILTIHSGPRTESDIFDFPEILRPAILDQGWDYSKIYVDDESHHHGHGHAYERYGISPKTGCLVVVRPDQHVGSIVELEDIDQVDAFFSAFMRSQN